MAADLRNGAAQPSAAMISQIRLGSRHPWRLADDQRILRMLAVD